MANQTQIERAAQWRQTSLDPNDPQVIEGRRRIIAGAQAPKLVADRIAYLVDCVRGKNILDIGIVAHTPDAYTSGLWLHGHLRNSAKSCLGVDILGPEIEQLRSLGYNVTVADITNAALPNLFDVIVAGELIEHVEAPGSLMKNCASMLYPGGRLILTTPNPWHINAVLKSCAAASTFVDSADHVAWYDASTLSELGYRNGLTLERFTGISGATPRSISARLLFSLQPFLVKLGISHLTFSKSIIYEFVKTR